MTDIGGVQYEELLRGDVRSYACNPANLSTKTEVKDIKKELIAQLEGIIRDLELQSDRQIAKIYIGKTFIEPREDGILDPLIPTTWRMDGISSRWGEHKHKDYGRDGLVVLGAITRETMPERCRDRVHQEDFTLAMEQKLLHHYLLSHPDPRVVNETFTAGQPPRYNHDVYALYMAFRYADRIEQDDFLSLGSLSLSLSQDSMALSTAPGQSQHLSSITYS